MLAGQSNWTLAGSEASSQCLAAASPCFTLLAAWVVMPSWVCGSVTYMDQPAVPWDFGGRGIREGRERVCLILSSPGQSASLLLLCYISIAALWCTEKLQNSEIKAVFCDASSFFLRLGPKGSCMSCLVTGGLLSVFRASYWVLSSKNDVGQTRSFTLWVWAANILVWDLRSYLLHRAAGSENCSSRYLPQLLLSFCIRYKKIPAMLGFPWGIPVVLRILHLESGVGRISVSKESPWWDPLLLKTTVTPLKPWYLNKH